MHHSEIAFREVIASFQNLDNMSQEEVIEVRDIFYKKVRYLVWFFVNNKYGGFIKQNNEDVVQGVHIRIMEKFTPSNYLTLKKITIENYHNFVFNFVREEIRDYIQYIYTIKIPSGIKINHADNFFAPHIPTSWPNSGAIDETHLSCDSEKSDKLSYYTLRYKNTTEPIFYREIFNVCLTKEIEDRDLLKKAILYVETNKHLKDNAKKAFALKYFHNETLEQISQKLPTERGSCSKEYVWQLIETVINSIRKKFREAI